MSMYQSKSSTRSTNLYLKACGEGLVKLSAENSTLSEERVNLLEKVAELESTLRAYEQVASMAADGKVRGNQIRSKVAELTGKMVNTSNNPPQDSSRAFTEKVSSTQKVNRKESSSVREFMDRLNSI